MLPLTELLRLVNKPDIMKRCILHCRHLYRVCEAFWLIQTAYTDYLEAVHSMHFFINYAFYILTKSHIQ